MVLPAEELIYQMNFRNKMTQIEKFNDEINKELANPASVRALMATTFKGLDEVNMKKAILEGYIRGATIQDFFEKNVYAIPFKDYKSGETGYSLIFSIDYSRKRGAKSGIVGKEAPVFEEKDGKIISCSVTVKRKIGDYIGDYTATVFFDEYDTKKNLWVTKPRTMISKVAESHALRMACPEELSQAYIEEEMDGGNVIDAIDGDTQAEINALENMEAVNEYYKANKGKGKAFDKAIIARKKELEGKESKPTGSDSEQPPF